MQMLFLSDGVFVIRWCPFEKLIETSEIAMTVVF